MFAIFQSLELDRVVILEIVILLIEVPVGCYQFYLVRKLRQTTKQNLHTLRGRVRNIETTVPSVLREAASKLEKQMAASKPEKQMAASRPGSSGADPE